MGKWIWYRFWKEVSHTKIDEEYVHFDSHVYSNGDGIKEECGVWANSRPGGHNTRYTFGFEKVDKPPEDVVKKMISWKIKDIRRLEKEVNWLLRWT